MPRPFLQSPPYHITTIPHFCLPAPLEWVCVSVWVWGGVLLLCVASILLTSQAARGCEAVDRNVMKPRIAGALFPAVHFPSVAADHPLPRQPLAPTSAAVLCRDNTASLRHQAWEARVSSQSQPNQPIGIPTPTITRVRSFKAPPSTHQGFCTLHEGPKREHTGGSAGNQTHL